MALTDQENKELIHSAGVVLVKQGPLVLVSTNRKYGGIALPGGKAGPTEGPWSAAVRELEEETGVRTSNDCLRLVLKAPSSVEPERMVWVFFAIHVYGILKPREEGTQAYFTTQRRLFDDSPFKDFYRQYFRQGFDHFADTKLEFYL
jgi:8-oxo-dGTP pyrophosphatase MutT (NUDIX family)